MLTRERPINKLMSDIKDGKIQLPDFQRGWVWEDRRIQALIASITCGYPVGAAMFLEYGNGNIRFKYRMLEGVEADNPVVPTELILDGQQRLTSIYSALFNSAPVQTKTNKDKIIRCFYYINIVDALDDTCDRVDAIFSVLEDKKITTNFGRDVVKDLSTRKNEFKNKAFPLNIILNPKEFQNWQNEYFAYYNYDSNIIKEFTQFYTEIILPTYDYQIPIIILEKNTPKEAVCQVFENVNTGGVSLTVFELLTAIFAMDDFELRKDWKNRQDNFLTGNLLSIVTATDFLVACTLLSTYKSDSAVSCKKKDVLNLSLDNYKKYAEILTQGFIEAEKILQEERIFSSRDLPYSTQLIPLAVICTLLNENRKINETNVKNKVKQWYWCGVFGELYGSANETRYVNDVVGMMEWINNNKSEPKTILDFYFNPMRLLTLQSRVSAAYKGIMALLLQNHCKDFISGLEMDLSLYRAENIDIHHIFPKKYCEENHYLSSKYNSIINKTPLTYSTNREIGGDAPSKYLNKIAVKGKVDNSVLNTYLESHLINVQYCRNDNFEKYISDRAKKLLNLIENSTGKIISGRDSEEVCKEFGEKLC